MAQIHKLEVATEVKCSADKFYSTIRNDMPQLAKIFPEIYKSIEVMEGDGRSVGSITHWKYSLGGTKVLVANERIVTMDDKNRSIAFDVIEGDILNTYKSFTFKVQVTTRCGGALVKWSMEFEKANEDVPNPDVHADLFDEVTKKLDSYLLQKA